MPHSTLMQPASEAPFTSLERVASLATRACDQLEQLIEDRRLRPGDRLPSERALAEHLGVSRTVIREAVRSLVARGLLEVRGGSGTVISQPTPNMVARSLTLLLRAGRQSVDYDEIAEVRRTLETEIAGLAAQRRSEDDLKTMADSVALLRKRGGDRDAFASSDVAFHAALAAAAHNAVFIVLLESVTDVMLQVRRMAFDVPGAVKSAVIHHRAILERVRERDADGARAAMRAHLDDSEAIMRRARQAQSRVDGR